MPPAWHLDSLWLSFYYDSNGILIGLDRYPEIVNPGAYSRKDVIITSIKE